MTLKETTIKDEAELEAILVNDPDQIEEGFKVLTHQRKTSGLSRMDILGVDSEGTLTIIELKVVMDSNQLRQALQYYDWVLQQSLDWIRDAYKDKLSNKKIEERMPQIFLVAPEFEQDLITEAKYFREDIKIILFKYLVFEINGKKEIKLIEVTIPTVIEIEQKPWTVEDNINYILDKDIQILFCNIIKCLKEFDSSVEEKAGNWVISYWVGGRKFCELYPRRKFFSAGFKTDNEQKWSWITNIKSNDEVTNVLEKLKKAYELMEKR